MKTEKSVPKKCIPLKNKWCQPVSDFATFHDPDAVGLAVNEVINMDTRATGYGLKIAFNKAQKKEFGFKSIWLNFCPFCGSDVSERTKKEDLS